MNVVIFGKGFGKPRQLQLSGLRCMAFALLISGVLGCATFASGYWFAAQSNEKIELAEVVVMSNELASQREALAAARQATEDTLAALAIRLGQMNARVIRMDALGRRLTEMAKLGDGEFDFDADPAVGGPEEPGQFGSTALMPDLTTAMDGLASQLDDREQQLGALESLMLNRNLSERVYPAGRPVKSGWISSYFGGRTDPFTGKPASHRGVDFAGKAGAEIAAVADGVVTWSKDRYGYGLMVEINHGNGYTTRYAHNSENLVKVGDEVKKGQVVALMGRTGRATGPNLHFEVLLRGHRMDPVKFIKREAGI